jgi:hypothetical protein
MLESREVAAAVRAMDVPVLGQVLAAGCSDEFAAFVAKLRAIKAGSAPKPACQLAVTRTQPAAP